MSMAQAPKKFYSAGSCIMCDYLAILSRPGLVYEWVCLFISSTLPRLSSAADCLRCAAPAAESHPSSGPFGTGGDRKARPSMPTTAGIRFRYLTFICKATDVPCNWGFFPMEAPWLDGNMDGANHDWLDATSSSIAYAAVGDVKNVAARASLHNHFLHNRGVF